MDILCDLCHEREASLFIEQAGGGGRSKMKVCMECAMERGFRPDKDNMKESLVKFINNVEAERKKIAEENAKQCPVCGVSLADIKVSRLMGCPTCYSTFKEHIDDIQKERAHTQGKKAKRHIYTGDLPRYVAKIQSPLAHKMDLKNKEAEAVRNEDYEKAAFYRDCIKALEK